MTFRLVIGIDPGVTGSIALLADGEFAGFIDIPSVPRRTKGNEVNGLQLSEMLDAEVAKHPGAYKVGVIERIGIRPGQSASSTSNFGETFGLLKGVLCHARIKYMVVQSSMWKRDLGLLAPKNEEVDKSAARLAAIEKFPAAAPMLQRVKDHNRADALWIAYWAEKTEQIGDRARRRAA